MIIAGDNRGDNKVIIAGKSCFIVTLPLFHDLLPVTSSPSLLPLLITCYLLLYHASSEPLSLCNKYHKLPMLLAHHAFILPLSYRNFLPVHGRDKTWITSVSSVYHNREQLLPLGREQLTMSAPYPNFPYKESLLCKELTGTF